MKRIISTVKHLFIIIRFQKCRVALAEMVGYLLAGHTDIGKNAHLNIAARYDKAMGVAGIVQFGEGGYVQLADRDGFKRQKRFYEMLVNAQSAASKRWRRDVHRKLVLFCKHRNAANMVGMLVRYKDRLYFTDRKAKPQHAFFGFTARTTGVD